MNHKISIYIHIPFCISKCAYCSFNSYPIGKYQSFIDDYFNKLISEIEYWSDKNLKIKSIYFGGGTPSIVKPIFLEKLIDKIISNFKLSNKCEISIEINPGTVDEKKINFYKSIGINRVSIGVQSFNDFYLKFLGRIYNSQEIFKCIEVVKKRYENFSLDLIFGIPNQSINDLKKDLNDVKDICPPHLSYYSLTIEKCTKLYKNGLKEISEELFSEMYNLIVESLDNIGLNQYEISNFSKKGYECMHNLNYWNYGNYLGFGAGAVSFLSNKRWKNFSNPIKYIKSSFGEYEEYEILNKEKMEFEYIFMNFRKVEGLSLTNYEKKFKKNFLNEYADVIEKFKDYFEISNENISLTKEGFKVSNIILSEFLK